MMRSRFVTWLCRSTSSSLTVPSLSVSVPLLSSPSRSTSASPSLPGHRSFSTSSSSSTLSRSRSFATSSSPARPSGISKPRVLSNPPEETPLTETIRDFLPPGEFYQVLKERGMDFYTGVPDSLLKDFCAYVTDNAPASNHVITANEGAAVGLATGYYLATRKFPIVYMQNSGYGNAVNPLLSLADPKVYSIPMLLLIGWRGEPGKKDEPQHIVQGKVMSSLLTDMNIQFEVLPDYIEGAKEAVESAIHYLERRSGPYAFLVKRQTFTSYKLQNKEPNIHHMTREDALRIIIEHTGNWDVIVSTTGFTSRELYELREQAQQDHRREFLTVGSMGHASAIALGTAMSKPSRQVICIDGDGAALMHMGTMATVGISKCENLKHILINNGSHDSVGGQPTRGFDISFTGIAKHCGYNDVFTVSTAEEIEQGMKRLRSTSGPVLMEILVNKGARKDLGRPTTTPIQNKIDFMGFLDG